MSRRKRILAEEKGTGTLRGLVKTIERVSWNAWFEEYFKCMMWKNALVVGKPYVVNVDLSRYDYRERYAAIPDKRLSEKISGERVRLILQPVVVGELFGGGG